MQDQTISKTLSLALATLMMVITLAGIDQLAAPGLQGAQMATAKSTTSATVTQINKAPASRS